MSERSAERDEEPRGWRQASLLPRDPAQDVALVFVSAVLCFFACLSVLAAAAAHHAATGWTTQLRDAATVLVRPGLGESADAAAGRAAEALAGVKGVDETSALEREKAEALVRPWLGDGVDLASLPVPRIVTVELDHRTPATAAALRQALTAAHIDAVVDDHSRWVGDITRGAAMTRLAATAIAVLMALATAAVIVLATRAGLLARGDVVEVLHLAGARPAFIIGLFQKRFARLEGVAGAIGAVSAAAVAAIYRLASGSGSLTPVAPITWPDLLLVLPCPFAAAIVAVLAARFAAQRRLRETP